MSRLDALKDPTRRPRIVMWAAVALLVMVPLVVAAIGITSTKWFCAEGCHKVQDDSIKAYQRSSHSEISCVACHYPVGADPITFVLHKMTALGEVYLTVTDAFELPLNGESHLAAAGKEMGSEQCTQCHTGNRRITPGGGVLIDHKVHAEKGVRCTMCHNRVAHREDFELELTSPDGKPNRKHEDFMAMEGCFRCHTQTPGRPPGSVAGTAGTAVASATTVTEEPAEQVGIRIEAPGDCRLCHPADFELKPANHLQAGFYTRFGESKGHADLKKALPDYCRICHAEDEFCFGCHRVPVPHPADFQKTHGAVGRSEPGVCANCHNKSGRPVADTEFCNSCHHPQGDPSRPWVRQHFVVVRLQGAGACFDCHESTFCAACHVRGIAR